MTTPRTSRFKSLAPHPLQNAARQPTIEAAMKNVAVDVFVLFDASLNNLSRYAQIRSAIIQTIGEFRRLTSGCRVGLMVYSAEATSAKAPLERELTKQLGLLRNFLDQHDMAIQGGLGCAAGQALEQALHRANEQSWRENARRAVILVGANPPRGVTSHSYQRCPANRDFRDEIESLRRQQIPVYSVALGQALETIRTFEWMSAETRGAAVIHSTAEELTELLTALSHHICGELRSYTRRIRSTGRVTQKFQKILQELAA